MKRSKKFKINIFFLLSCPSLSTSHSLPAGKLFSVPKLIDTEKSASVIGFEVYTTIDVHLKLGKKMLPRVEKLEE